MNKLPDIVQPLGVIGNTAIIILCLLAISGCRNNSNSTIIRESSQAKIDTLFISASQDYALTAQANLPKPEFVILKEDDNTMYSDISRLIDAYGKYFILDSWGSRKLVSFDHYGNPIISYGRRGKGPEEYVAPNDFDVDKDNVYLLDSSNKSLLIFGHDGSFKIKRDVPFYADALCHMNNGDFIFKVSPGADKNYQLCITDSLLNPIAYMLPYPKDYVGGFVTVDTFRKSANGLTYYSSPSDTIYHLDNSGDIVSKTVLAFEKGSIDELAKLDYVKAFDQGLLTKGGMQLNNNPIILPDGRGYGSVNDARKRHVLFFNVNSNESGITTFGDMTAFSPVLPVTIDYNNRLISFLTPEIIELTQNTDELPDSVKTALEDGNRVLTIF